MTPGSSGRTTKQIGDAAENRALLFLMEQGLQLQQRNYRTPGRGGGEIDLIMHAPDGTLVFVEVRARQDDAHGGAAASVGRAKQRRIVRAAQHFLLRAAQLPPCRFDVVEDGPTGLTWLQGAFDAG